MKRITIATLMAGLLATCTMLTSCLGDNEETTVTYSNEAYISAVRFGALRRLVTTQTAAGADTTYATTLSATAIPFTIDQYNNRIYNHDPLPYGTQVNKLVFTTLTGTNKVFIKSLSSGQDTLFVTTDSTDFSTPRQVTVYSASGAVKKTYTMTVNVSAVASAVATWNKVTISSKMAALTTMKALVADSKLYVFGQDTEPVVLTAAVADGTTWTRQALTGVSALDLASVQYFGGRFVGVDGTTLVESADGVTWTSVSTGFAPDLLVTAGAQKLYALQSGVLYGSADALDWTAEEVNGLDSFPTTATVGVNLASLTTASINRVSVIGQYNGMMRVYGKDENLTGVQTFRWTNIASDYSAAFALPSMSSLSAAVYGRHLLAAGLSSDTLALYASRDAGLTWTVSDTYPLPSGMSQPTAVALATDVEGYLWLLSAGTGEIWRGRVEK